MANIVKITKRDFLWLAREANWLKSKTKTVQFPYESTIFTYDCPDGTKLHKIETRSLKPGGKTTHEFYMELAEVKPEEPKAEPKEEKKVIYLVQQTQPEEEYFNTAIYACSTFERAQQYARQLNKEYGRNCVFDEDWDFIEYDMKGEPHYYTVESLKLDEPLAPNYGKDEKSTAEQIGLDWEHFEDLEQGSSVAQELAQFGGTNKGGKNE